MSNFASVEAEQAVLGSMLIDSGCVRRVAAILRESDFSVALNQDLYRVIVTMDRDGQPIDGLTVCAAAEPGGGEDAAEVSGPADGDHAHGSQCGDVRRHRGPDGPEA